MGGLPIAEQLGIETSKFQQPLRLMGGLQPSRISPILQRVASRNRESPAWQVAAWRDWAGDMGVSAARF